MAQKPEASQTSLCRILVLASGTGSNFQALIEGVAAHHIPNSSIIRLIVNRSKARAQDRARDAGIPSEYFNPISHGFQAKGETDPARKADARSRYDAALAAKILEQKPDLVVCAGWMHVFGRTFLEPLLEANVRIINLHPALPGAYDGADAIGRAFQDFQDGKTAGTGIMVHEVVLEVDRGAPILLEEIEMRLGETLDQLEQRIHTHEHQLIVKATAKVVNEIQGRA